jgi:hypothetical protein
LGLALWTELGRPESVACKSWSLENQRMANNKEEAGKGTPRPGEMSATTRRPYATIDLTASEVGGSSKDKPPSPAASAASSSSAASGKAQAEADAKSTASQPKPPGSGASGGSSSGDPPGAKGAAPAKGMAIPSTTLLSHLAAGAAGALIVVAATQFLTSGRPAPALDSGDAVRRLTDIENALGTRPGAGVRGRIEELSRTTGALGEAQAKLVREAKALEGKISGTQEVPPEIATRLAKLEEALGAVSAADPSAQSPQVAALAGKLAELDKAVRQVSEAVRSAAARQDSELSALRTEAGRLGQRIDVVKGEVEERVKSAAKAADLAPLTSKLAVLERDAQTIIKSEADRAANATNILLALELANLKRAIDRGEGYAEELARAKKVAGSSVNFAPLERYMREGALPSRELARSFGKTADAMIDAESETADSSLLERMLSGARSIVRVRKVGQSNDDVSLQAIIARMEAALKDNRLTDVLEQAKKLPPKAALAGEEWIKKVEARQAVEKAIGEVETSLRSSLGAPQGATTDVKK